MSRIRVMIAMTAVSAVLTFVPSPAPAAECSEPLRGVCRAVCQVGQRLGFECIASSAQR